MLDKQKLWDKTISVVIQAMYINELEKLPEPLKSKLLLNPKIFDDAIKAYQNDNTFYLKCQRLTADIIQQSTGPASGADKKDQLDDTPPSS